MDPQLEYPRRQRLFRRALFTFAGAQILLFMAYFADLLALGPAFLILTPLMLAGLGLLTFGARWVQRAQPRLEVSAQEAATLATAQQTFVRRRGMLGFGLLWGVTMAAWNTWDVMPAHTLEAFGHPGVWVRFAVMLVWYSLWGLGAGYLWGRLMWNMMTPRTATRPE